MFDKIIRFKNYFIASNGGVTISGGEPLLQTKFLINLFKKLRKENIHTAIDTSGMLPLTDDIKELISLTDLILLDIKHIDPKKCEQLVGFSNEKELDFARYLSNINKKMWIRQVLIPGITDDENDLIKLKEFIKSLNNVENIEILPYHDLGKFKWEKLGLSYELQNIRPATSEDVAKAKQLLEI